jgi:hypothetical protein
VASRARELCCIHEMPPTPGYPLPPPVHPTALTMRCAVIMTGVVVVQICSYDRGGQRLHWLAIAILAVLITAILVVVACTGARAGPWFTWLDTLLFLSYVKLAITLMK